MGSYYAEPPINPSPEPWSFPPPDYFSASPNEYRSPFVSSFSPDTWYGDPPINTSKLTYFPPKPDYFSMSPEEYRSRGFFSPEDTWYPEPPISKVVMYFSTSYPQLPDLSFRTLGEGLHELHNNSSSGAPKANDDSSALANVEGSWVNISDADGNKPTDTLYGETVSDGCGDSNGKLTIVESMGTAAGAHNWNSKEKSSESKAAWNTSREKETGEGGAAGEYHTCEELSGHGSCGNACYTCAEADHFARKCTLGADCGCSGHHSGGSSTIPSRIVCNNENEQEILKARSGPKPIAGQIVTKDPDQKAFYFRIRRGNVIKVRNLLQVWREDQVGASCCRIEYNWQPREVEAISLREAISWTKSLKHIGQVLVVRLSVCESCGSFACKCCTNSMSGYGEWFLTCIVLQYFVAKTAFEK